MLKDVIVFTGNNAWGYLVTDTCFEEKQYILKFAPAIVREVGTPAHRCKVNVLVNVYNDLHLNVAPNMAIFLENRYSKPKLALAQYQAYYEKAAPSLDFSKYARSTQQYFKKQNA